MRASLLQPVTLTCNKEITLFQLKHSHRRRLNGRCITLNEQKKKSDRKGRKLRNKLSKLQKQLNKLLPIGTRLKSNPRL